MKLAISNIDCYSEEDDQIYFIMKKYDFKSAKRKDRAKGLKIVSMQSLHFGKEERKNLIEYTKRQQTLLQKFVQVI